MSPTTTYPAPEVEHYGHGVSPLGEDGDMGVVVWGHGRRALAALNAYERGMLGSGDWRRHNRLSPEWEEIWVVFHEDCGCTPEQHAEHQASARRRFPDGDIDCDCLRTGLPPCDPDMYGWTFDRADQGTPGALPVTEVTW